MLKPPHEQESQSASLFTFQDFQKLYLALSEKSMEDSPIPRMIAKHCRSGKELNVYEREREQGRDRERESVCVCVLSSSWADHSLSRSTRDMSDHDFFKFKFFAQNETKATPDSAKMIMNMYADCAKLGIPQVSIP